VVIPALTTAFVEQDQLVLLYRNDANALMQRRLPAEWSSFYRRAEIEPHLRELSSSRFVRSVADEGDWVRIRWSDRWVRERACSPDSPLSRAGVVAFEADLSPVQRFLADSGAKIARPNWCVVDFETDSRVSPREAAIGNARLLSWVITRPDLTDITGVLEADTDEAERDLWEAFFLALDEFDLVLAWNGDDFDFQLMPVRVQKVRARVKDKRRWLFLDYMVLFERMNRNAAESGDEKVSLKLNVVCEAMIGEGKEEFDPRRTFEAWEDKGRYKSRAEMVRYMRQDSALVVKLDRKTGYLALHQTISEVCGVFPDSYGMNPTRFVDGFMLRVAVERGTHFPSKIWDREPEQQFAGAWVMEPKDKGFIENVHVGDFKSLYPSIMITWNMSPDTKVATPPGQRSSEKQPEGFCRSPSNGVVFRTDIAGMLTDALKELIRLRDFWKKRKSELPPNTDEWRDADRKSMAYKVAANSFYGVVGSIYSRFFDRDIAEGVTQNGVWLIKRTSDAAERPGPHTGKGLRTTYGDTDSLFIVGGTELEFDAFARWCNESLYPDLLRGCGCQENKISFAYEKMFERIVILSAKKYVGRLRHYGWDAKRGDWNWATDKSKPEVKGLEWKRGDANKIARALQYEAIKIVCAPARADAMDPARYVEVVECYKRHVLEDPLTVDDVKQSRALSKRTDEYEQKLKKDQTPAAVPPHVTIARLLEERGEQIVIGSKIDYVIQDGSKDEGNLKAIPASEYDGQNADRHYLWEKMIWPPTQRLLAAAFPLRDWSQWDRTRPPKNQQLLEKAGQGRFTFGPKSAP
jgi:DNA polymerase I